MGLRRPCCIYILILFSRHYQCSPITNKARSGWHNFSAKPYEELYALLLIYANTRLVLHALDDNANALNTSASAQQGFFCILRQYYQHASVSLGV